MAKACLDMGDPEGARSMLDEVMSGNDSQEKRAR
jgi:FimV-like protein